MIALIGTQLLATHPRPAKMTSTRSGKILQASALLDHQRRVWHKADDLAVLEAVRRHGKKSWSVIAEAAAAASGRPRKTAKQVRARWVSLLDPRRPWTPIEARFIHQMQIMLGNKWSAIAQRRHVGAVIGGAFFSNRREFFFQAGSQPAWASRWAGRIFRRIEARGD